MERLNNNPELQQTTVRAITPEEIVELQKEAMPPEILDTVNRLIAEKLRNNQAVLLQKDIVTALEELGMIRREIYDKHWLDFEQIYREAGWNVLYDKPGWNESYEASFKFEPQRGRRIGSLATRRCVTCYE